MHPEQTAWRRVGYVGLGALAYVLLPLNGLVPTIHGAGIPATGSLIASALVAAAVVGLLGADVRPRWIVSAMSAAAMLVGVGALALLGRAHLEPIGLGAGLAFAAVVSWAIAAIGSTAWRVAAEIVSVTVVLLVALWFAGLLPGTLHGAPAAYRRAELAQTPQPEHYTFDGKLFLRTYILMKGGAGYYQAFRQSVVEDSRHDAAFLTSPFNYREPLVFEVWRALPGSSGNDLFMWFVAWSLATMVFAYLLASRLVAPGAALLAPIALTTFFFYFWWAGLWFLIVEVWAAGLAVAAVAALVRGRRIASLVLLVGAVATREFMVLLIPAWLAAWWFWGADSRRSSWWFPALAVAGPAIVLAAHVASIPAMAPGGGGVGGWLRGGPVRLVDALRFGWDASIGFEWIPLVIAAAAIAGAALARPRWRTAALVCATVLPTLFLLAFSGGQPWRYWGAFYTPLAVAIAPGVLGRVLSPWPTGRQARPTDPDPAAP